MEVSASEFEICTRIPTRAAVGGWIPCPTARIGLWAAPSPFCLLHSPGEAASLMPQMADYKSHSFPAAITEHRCFKAKIWQLKKHLRSFTPLPLLSGVEDYHMWLYNNFPQPELFSN